MKTLKSWITRVSKKTIPAFLLKSTSSTPNTSIRRPRVNTSNTQSKQVPNGSRASFGTRDSIPSSSLDSDTLTVTSLSLGFSATLSNLLVSLSSFELSSWSSEDMAFFETELNGRLECLPVYIAARPENQPPLYGDETNIPSLVQDRP